MSTKNLGDIAQVISGYAFKSTSFSKSGVPVIKIKNIRNGYVDLSDPVYVSDHYLGIDKKYHIQRGDILISLTGSHMSQPNSVVGRVAYNRNGEPALLNQRAGKVIIKDSDVSPEYLYYLLSSANVRKRIAMMASGAASQANVSPRQVESLRLSLLEPDKQIRTAGIISSYDELIETNHRRIEKLKEMAQLLYVQSTVDNPSEVEIGEITELISRGISPKYDVSGNSLVLNQRCIRDKRIDFTLARKQSISIPTAKLIRSGDVLINSTGVGTLGRVAQVYGEYPKTTIDSHVSIVRVSEDVNQYFFGAALMDSQTEFERSGTGATGQTELSRDAIARVSIPVPSRDIQDSVGGKIKVIRELVHNLQQKNELLAKTRDLLLPRLMSGEIEV